MPVKTEGWLKRANELLQERASSEAVQFAVSMTAEIYGAQSPQMLGLNAALAQIAKAAKDPNTAMWYQSHHAHAAIKNIVAEIDGGLISSIRAQVAGEILSELVRLGKEILGEQTDSAKNVAAVLVAAAFEDLMRRMGQELGGVVGRPSLQDVVTALKDACVLKGGEIGTAQSFLKFRNDSLHADWANVSRVLVEFCTAFIDAMLIKHFS